MEETKRQRGRPKDTKKGLIKFFEPHELDRFVRAIRKDPMNDFLFSLMLYIGARVSEICDIRLTDMTLNEHRRPQITINGKKGGDTMTYPLSDDRLRKKYERWRRVRDTTYPDSPWLFPAIRTGAKMGVDIIKFRFKKALTKAGLDDSFSCHSLRHTCAIMLLRRGMRPTSISQWLRHKSMDMLLRYCRIAGREYEATVAQANDTFREFY